MTELYGHPPESGQGTPNWMMLADQLGTLIIEQGESVCYVPASSFALPYTPGQAACAAIATILMQRWQEAGTEHNWHITYDSVTRTFVAIDRAHIATMNARAGDWQGQR